MRYSEKGFDREISNTSQLIVFLLYTLLFAPIRLTSEIGKKLIFLGRFTDKFFMTSVIMNTVVFLIYSAYSLIVSKEIRIIGGTMSLTTLVISLVVLIVYGVVFEKCKFKLDIDFDSEDEEMEGDLSDIFESPKEVEEVLDLGLGAEEEVMEVLEDEKVVKDPIYSLESKEMDNLLIGMLNKSSSDPSTHIHLKSDIDKKSESRIQNLDINSSLLGMLEKDSYKDIREDDDGSARADYLDRVSRSHQQNARAQRADVIYEEDREED